WFEPRHIGEMADRALVAFPDREVVGDEQHVEQPALGELRQLNIVGEVHAGIGNRRRMAPRGHVMAARIEKGAELHLLLAGHRGSFSPKGSRLNGTPYAG